MAPEDATTDSGPAVLQAWTGYVDEIDDDTVTMILTDRDADTDEEMFAKAPSSLLAHLSPRRGQLVEVEILSDRTVRIYDTPVSEEKSAEDRRALDRMLDTLRKVRFD